jgi:hypothetical protein
MLYRGEVRGCNFEKIFMKFLKQKKVAVIFLALVMFFCGAQKGRAADGFWGYIVGFNYSDGTRDCYCSKDTIGSDGGRADGNSAARHNGVNIGRYKIAADCGKACYDKGYVSFTLIDRKTSLDSANLALPENALGNIPDSYKTRPALQTVPGGAQITNDIVPGTTVGESKIITCGRPGQHMCHLCDLVKGFYNIIKYIQGIAIGVALLAMAIGGIIYIVSAGESGMMETAKSAIKNAAIGFVIIFASYLIVNTTIVYLGTKAGLGINASWGTVDCNSTAVERTDQ